MGKTDGCVPFLGCEIRSGAVIRPDSSSWRRLIHSLELELEESKRHMHEPEKLPYNGFSLVETLLRCSNITRGWGSQYSFCNDKLLMNQIDDKIDRLIRDYLGFYSAKKEKMELRDKRNNRRLLGLSLISDCKSEPIIKE